MFLRTGKSIWEYLLSLKKEMVELIIIFLGIMENFEKTTEFRSMMIRKATHKAILLKATSLSLSWSRTILRRIQLKMINRKISSRILIALFLEQMHWIIFIHKALGCQRFFMWIKAV